MALSNVSIKVTSIPKMKFLDPRMHVFYAEAETWRQNKTQGSERFTIQTNDRCAKARTAPTTILPPTWNKYAPNCHVHHAFCSWCDGVGLYIGTWGVWRYYSPGQNIRGMHPTCHIIVHQWSLVTFVWSMQHLLFDQKLICDNKVYDVKQAVCSLLKLARTPLNNLLRGF